MSSVAVVIPVKNGYPEIKACIEGILMQTIKVNRILVIDSGSTDDTIPYLETIKEVELLKIDSLEFNHGETRNIGWRHCSEDFLFYTVQDASAASATLLEDLMKGFTDEEVAAVCGRQIVPHDKDKNPIEWYRPQSTPQLLRYQFKNTDEFNLLTPEQKNTICSWDDVVAIYRSKIFKDIPFQHTVFGEDMIWAKEALLKGYAIAYNQTARIHHYHLENAAISFKRNFTVMYFRYKEFQFIQPQPVLTFRKRLSIIKWIIRSLGLDIKAIVKWYFYNINNLKALIRSHNQFIQSVREGDAVLDQKHTELCGIPPIPLKVN